MILIDLGRPSIRLRRGPIETSKLELGSAKIKLVFIQNLFLFICRRARGAPIGIIPTPPPPLACLAGNCMRKPNPTQLRKKGKQLEFNVIMIAMQENEKFLH